MSTEDFDALETEALVAAGKAGAAYLKGISANGLLDHFADLDTDQALEFLARIIDGFGAHLKFKLVADHRPPSQGQGGR